MVKVIEKVLVNYDLSLVEMIDAFGIEMTKRDRNRILSSDPLWEVRGIKKTGVVRWHENDFVGFSTTEVISLLETDNLRPVNLIEYLAWFKKVGKYACMSFLYTAGLTTIRVGGDHFTFFNEHGNLVLREEPSKFKWSVGMCVFLAVPKGRKFNRENLLPALAERQPKTWWEKDEAVD